MKRFVPRDNKDNYFNGPKKFNRGGFSKPAFSISTNYDNTLPWIVDNSVNFLASFTGRVVTARPYESTESLLKRFKRSVESSGVLAELKRREYFKSDSIKRKEKSLKARKRLNKTRNTQGEKYFDTGAW